jgi:putative MFS transporter
LLLGIAGTSAMLSVLNTYTTELFPTELRGDAFGWANSLLGRLAAVFSPMLVGKLAASWGWGLAVSSTALGPLLALVLILMLLPETRGQELEQTSQLR